jgi:hypothetical protein
MEKIIFIANNHVLNTKSIDFACYLAGLSRSKLTGAFVEEEVPELLPAADYGHSYLKEVKESEAAAFEVVTNADQNRQYFVQECGTQGIRCDVCQHKDNGAKELVHQSRFTDLLIFGSEMLLTQQQYSQVPAPLVRRVLTGAECPVIIAPTAFKGIDDVVFCYDGSASSVFAMKLFTYLLPQYTDKRVTVLEVAGEERPVKDKDDIGAWLSGYYSQIGFHVLQGGAKEELFKYFFMKEKTFIVMGAYGRNMLSQFFRSSSANTVIKAIDLPLFIAHH